MAVSSVTKFTSGATYTYESPTDHPIASTHDMATQFLTITDDPYLPIRLITECTFRGEDVLIVFPTQKDARRMFPTQLITVGNPAGDGRLGMVYIRSAEMKSSLKSVNVRNVIFVGSENIDDQAKSIAQSKTAGHTYPNIWFLEL